MPKVFNPENTTVIFSENARDFLNFRKICFACDFNGLVRLLCAANRTVGRPGEIPLHWKRRACKGRANRIFCTAVVQAAVCTSILHASYQSEIAVGRNAVFGGYGYHGVVDLGVCRYGPGERWHPCQRVCRYPDVRGGM